MSRIGFTEIGKILLTEVRIYIILDIQSGLYVSMGNTDRDNVYLLATNPLIVDEVVMPTTPYMVSDILYDIQV